MKKNKYGIFILITAIVYFGTYYLFFFSNLGFSINNLKKEGADASERVFVYSPETAYEYYNQTGIPDLRFYYSRSHIMYYFTQLDDIDLSNYRKILYFDFVYAAIYGLFYFSIILFFVNRIWKGKFFFLIFIPFIAVILDYIENFNLLQLLNGTKNFNDDGLANLGSITVAKHFAIMLSQFTILILIILFFRRGEKSEYMSRHY